MEFLAEYKRNERKNKILEILIESQLASGMTDQKLAGETGISSSLLSYIKSGKRPMTVKTSIKVAKIFPDEKLHIINELTKGGNKMSEPLTTIKVSRKQHKALKIYAIKKR